MRVLFSTLPASGHWHPLVPFAAALRAAGHEVAFATASERCAAIAALGFRCFPAGTEETAEEAQERRDRLAVLGTESAAWVWPNLFAGRWAGSASLTCSLSAGLGSQRCWSGRKRTSPDALPRSAPAYPTPQCRSRPGARGSTR